MERTRVVVVGAGFAGYNAVKALTRRAGPDVEIVLINPTDYFLYVPLLPDVASGSLDPRHIAVSIVANLRARFVLGQVDAIDLAEKRVEWVNPDGERGDCTYDRLVLAAGSVNKLLPIPGVAEHAHGFRDLPEALYLRDHIVRQVEQAADTSNPGERAARCTFIVVGAGYTGTEVAAQCSLLTADLMARHPALRQQGARWMLLDLAPRVLPELDEHLSRNADAVLRSRGVEVRMGDSVKEATDEGVVLTNGETIRTRSLIWCVGVRPDPLASAMGVAMDHGRVVVDEYLTVPGHPEVFACGDAAAVPDLTRPGKLTGMTAQHAMRQGKRAGRNVAASLGRGERRPYKHHDLGFVVDLGGRSAAASPLNVPLAGFPAKVVTRGYHLSAMPGNRLRVATDWALDAVAGRQTVHLGLVPGQAVPLETAKTALPPPEHDHAPDHAPSTTASGSVAHG